MMSLLVFVSNLILLSSMTPPSEDSRQPSIYSMPPQDTHSDSLPDQNSHHYLLSNILSVFSILVVTRALSKLESLLDKMTSWFPAVIYTWLSKLHDKYTVVLQLLGTSCWYRDNFITKLWAHRSYFLYLYIVFFQHCFHSKQHCFHVLRTFQTDWD